MQAATKVARKIELVSRLLTNSVLRVLISSFPLALSYRNYENYDFLIQNLIDQAVAGAGVSACSNLVAGEADWLQCEGFRVLQQVSS